MPRTYSVSFDTTAITTAIDLFEITPADDKPVRLIGMVLGQYTDSGDAQAEQLGIRVIRGYTTSGSGGVAPTPTPLDPTDTAAGFTAEACNTTVATTGTSVVCLADVFNVQAGYQIWWPEGCQPQANQGNTTIVVRMTAPADSITTNGTLYVQEL